MFAWPLGYLCLLEQADALLAPAASEKRPAEQLMQVVLTKAAADSEMYLPAGQLAQTPDAATAPEEGPIFSTVAELNGMP